MERLVEWNCKEKNSALPIAINDFGDVVSMEDICAQLATLYDIIGDCSLDRLREALQKQSEYEEFMEHWKDAVAIAGAVKDVGADRVAELVEADKAGRLYKFRFGVGSTVYRVWVRPDGTHPFISEDKIECLRDMMRAELWAEPYSTREEAEAALENLNKSEEEE